MKKLVYSCAVFLLFSFVLHAKTITGADADKMISGAELIIISTKSSIPEFIRFREGKEISSANIILWIKTCFGLNENIDLNLLNVETDQFGISHYRYQQTFNNIPVEGTMYIVHAKGDKVASLNGLILDKINIASQPALGESAALDKALAYMNADSYRWQSVLQEKELKRVTNNKDATWFPKGMLTAAPMKGQLQANSYRLAYRFDIYADKPLKREYVYVDAKNGQIIYTIDRIETANASGIAVTAYSGTQKITTDSTATTNFRLRETGRGNGIETYNLQTSTDYGSAVDFTDADDYWNNVNAAQDQYATDAHWGAEKTYDFYLQKFSRNGIDNSGFKLLNYVHYSVAYGNAFWDGQEMTYGDGGAGYTPFTSLEIIGHEISHGLTQFTSNLPGAGEGGALNEGNSDCMGISIRHFGEQSNVIDWLIGDEIGGTSFRNVADPKATGNPDTYQGTNWDFVTQEVHQNSTVLSHWFYLLTMGGSGTNDNNDAYSVTGIGIEEAQAICFRMNTVYLTINSEYADAKTYSIQAAVDLFGPCSNEVIQATNAWHAVGIGNAFVFGVTGAFASSATTSCGVPVNISFSNTSNNATNFIWNFGDGETSTNANPVHTYTSYGTFTVTLIANGGACGIDTVVKTSYITLSNQSPNTAGNISACKGTSVKLTAAGSDTIKWYNMASGGSPIGTGNTFNTPALSTTTTYYAESDIYPPPAILGAVDNTIGTGSYFTANYEWGEVFTCFSPVNLISVVVYAEAAGNRTINLRDSAGNIIQSKIVNIPAGQNTVILNFNIPIASNMILSCNAPNLYRNDGGANYPYLIPGVISITDNYAHYVDNSQAGGYYYYFYNWQLQEAPCITARTPVTININDNAAFTFTTSDLTVNFADGSTNATSWHWNFGDGDTSSQQNPAHTYGAPGTYTATLIAESNGCADTVYHIVNVVETSLVEYPKGIFSLFPNPANDWFTVYSLQITTPITLVVYNMLGERMTEERIKLSDHSRVSAKNLPAGIYFVKIENEGGIWIGKFVKE